MKTIPTMLTAWLLTVAVAVGLSATGLHAAQPWFVVDTGQTKCYNTNSVITAPVPGQPFYGQDAQF